MEIKDFAPQRHGEAVKRMWVEAGWGDYRDAERVFIETLDWVLRLPEPWPEWEF